MDFQHLWCVHYRKSLNAYIYLVGLAILTMSLGPSVMAQRYTIEKIGLEEGMPSARVNDIIEDSRGFLWIATEGAGIVRYDGHEFEQLDPGIPSLQPIATALAEDSLGRLWFAMEDALVRYDGVGFTKYTLPRTSTRIIAIDFNDLQEPLLATRRHLFKWMEGDTLQMLEFPEADRINDIIWHKNALWVASSAGLYSGKQLIARGEWQALSIYGESLVAQSADSVWSAENLPLEQFRGKYISSSDGVLVSLGKDSLLLKNSMGLARLGNENGLPDVDFKGCYVDRSGVVWLYSNSGLYKIPDTGYRLYDQLGEVFSVTRHQDRFLAGTAAGLAEVLESGSEISLSDNFQYGVILAIAYHNGEYWLGTESGLVRYDGRSFRLVPLQRTGGDFVFALHSDGKTLWIGAGSGIFRYRNAEIDKISINGREVLASVYAISEAQDGSLWFATYTQGLFRYFRDEWEVVRSLGEFSLDSLRFTSFSAISATELYLGTLSEGVFRVSDKGYDQISSEQLNYAEVRAVNVSGENLVWVSTNKGIYYIQKKNNDYSIEHLQLTQSMMDQGGVSQALYVDREILLAGTEKGMLLIDLSEVFRERTPPKLAITGIELFYGQIGGLKEYADGIQPFSHLPVDLKLPNNLNFLSFKLAGLTGYQPNSLVYRYRIEKDREWTLAGRRREAVFSNLSPGSYHFQAQVARPGEAWGDEILEYSFRIKPPVWQQWWFILLSAFLIGGLSYWYIRNRIERINQRLRLQNSLMDMERKALRLQMNPHFIFNALDSISSFIFKNDVEQAVRYLNNFAKLMRLTLESSMEHLHPVESEVSILKNYLELEKLRFQGKLEYEIEVSDEIDFDVGIPPMLIQPHVENAILHGIKPKEGPGKVSIRFYLEDESLVCEVEDDGIGRARSREMQKRQDHRSMATRINRDRLELLKKSLGGNVDIRIIDKKEPTGTLVRICLPAEQY